MLVCAHLYTWLEGGTVKVQCLVQEHNTKSPARTRTPTARLGDGRTNHEATAAILGPFKLLLLLTSKQFYFACFALSLQQNKDKQDQDGIGYAQ